MIALSVVTNSNWQAFFLHPAFYQHYIPWLSWNQLNLSNELCCEYTHVIRILCHLWRLCHLGHLFRLWHLWHLCHLRRLRHVWVPALIQKVLYISTLYTLMSSTSCVFWRWSYLVLDEWNEGESKWRESAWMNHICMVLEWFLVITHLVAMW